MFFYNGTGEVNMHEKICINTASGFSFFRGVNISHWLSQTLGTRRDFYFADDDLRTIKELGFDHVRILIDEHEMWNDDGLVIGYSFLMLKKCLDMCLRNSLKAVIVIKELRCADPRQSHSGNASLWENILAQENLMKLWRNLSDFLKDYPRSMLAYEILSEPDAPTDEQWNGLMHEVYSTIRMRERERTIIIGSNSRQSASAVAHLHILSDPNIIVSIRFFKPFAFTHYKAEWTAMDRYSGPVCYPGQTINPDLMLIDERNDARLSALLEQENEFSYCGAGDLLQALQPVADLCREKGVGLYCSQFGCLPTVPSAMRAQYYKDITSCFKQLEMAYSYWDFKGRFGVLIKNELNEYVPDPTIIDTM